MTSHNPYAPPKAKVESATALAAAAGQPDLAEPLCTPNQLLVASILAGPVASAWLARTNFIAMGQPETARAVIGWSVVFVVLMVAVTRFLPMSIPNSAIVIGYSVAIRILAEMRFGLVLRQHRDAGGLIMSWWRAIGIALLFMAIMLASLVILVMILMSLGFMGRSFL